MKRVERFPVVCVALGGAALLAGHGALADVTLEERLSVEGAGFMSFANLSGTSTTSIADGKARMHSAIRFESRLARMFAGNVPDTVDIVRLDEDRLYRIDPERREYTELSLAEQREELRKAMEDSREAQQQQPAPLDESQCEWSDARVDVTGGDRADIAGYPTEQQTVTVSRSCTDRESGQVCDFSMSLERWVTADFDPEVAGFMHAYAEALGMDAAGSGDFAHRAEALLGRYDELWTEIAARTAELEGYPLKSVFALAVGGAQCAIGGQGESGGRVSAADVGGAVGGIAGRMAGGLLGRQRQREADPPEASAIRPLITLTSEVVSVSQQPVERSAFEVPADYTRVSSGN